MDNPLSKLALDYWYQVLMVVSFVVFLSAGAGVLSAFPTIPTAVISLGCFFVGLGEWINHPLQTALMSATAYHPGGVITSHPRNPRFVGVAFDVLGAILIVFGLYRLLA
ncbi:hypothetical protein [Methylomonas sp. CM2]|uniref:hypothetical protein n=1 Tax=Methylomonas sp. CM2 TaxID=3417647 RepID=UPI003CF86D22